MTHVRTGEGASEAWQPPIVPQAWNDGIELVIRVGTPLPPICVFCGDPATTTTKIPIEVRGQPFVGLQVNATRFPVCEQDNRTHRSQRRWFVFAFLVGFAMLVFTGWLPGLAGLFFAFLSPYGPRPGLRAVVLALVFLFLGALVRRLRARYLGPEPQPLGLEFAGSGDGFIWLKGAPIRYLVQLPPIRPVSPSAIPVAVTERAGASWFGDPSGRHRVRYWDGTRWTSWVADGGQAFQEPATH